LAVLYLDTSVLVKLYVSEPGSDRIMRFMLGPATHRFVVSTLTRVEFRGAVRRLQREGLVGRPLADELLDRLAKHWGRVYTPQPLTEVVLSHAASLLDRHPLRSLDAVQLASCLVLQMPPRPVHPLFVSSDDQLLKAAATEGLRVWNPATSDLK